MLYIVCVFCVVCVKRFYCPNKQPPHGRKMLECELIQKGDFLAMGNLCLGVMDGEAMAMKQIVKRFMPERKTEVPAHYLPLTVEPK